MKKWLLRIYHTYASVSALHRACQCSFSDGAEYWRQKSAYHERKLKELE